MFLLHGMAVPFPPHLTDSSSRSRFCSNVSTFLRQGLFKVHIQVIPRFLAAPRFCFLSSQQLSSQPSLPVCQRVQSLTCLCLSLNHKLSEGRTKYVLFNIVHLFRPFSPQIPGSVFCLLASTHFTKITKCLLQLQSFKGHLLRVP